MPTSPKTYAQLRNPKIAKEYRPKKEYDGLRDCVRWRKVRKMVVMGQPMCYDPYLLHKKTGTLKASEEVHHIKPLHTNPELAYTMSNLVGLCQSCHARVDALYLRDALRSVMLFK